MRWSPFYGGRGSVEDHSHNHGIGFCVEGQVRNFSQRTNVDFPLRHNWSVLGLKLNLTPHYLLSKLLLRPSNRAPLHIKPILKKRLWKKIWFSRPKRFSTDNFCQARADIMLCWDPTMVKSVMGIQHCPIHSCIPLAKTKIIIFFKIDKCTSQGKQSLIRIKWKQVADILIICWNNTDEEIRKMSQ